MLPEDSVAPTVCFRSETLAGFCQQLLTRSAVPAKHAQIVSESLVAANLRGVDSHGIQMLVTYLQQLQAGGINAPATGRVVSENGACLIYDGENGLGQVIADRCVDHALRLVRTSGLALVVANHSNHFGAGAYWGEKIARAGCIGVVMSNACPAVAPWQGRTPIFGTNPLCMAVPGEKWLLDMATTTVALGKLGHAANLNQPQIPATWGFRDESGQITTDTQAAMRGAPSPIGGYKGTGLAMMVEILCAMLSGGSMATELPVFRTGGQPLGISHSFLLIDIERFLPQAGFKDRMDRLARMVKNSEPASGYSEVLVAGEPEWRCEAARQRDGIPVPTKLWARLCSMAADLGVPAPEPV